MQICNSHYSPVTSQGDFAFCCTVTLAESKTKVDRMVNVLEALLNEESHKEHLQARGRHKQTTPALAGKKRKTRGSV